MVDIRTRLFQSWWRLARPMTMGVRGIVENANQQVLLVRHTYTAGLYLPGGGVERGEPAIEALKRELVEEAGIEARAADLTGIYSNHANFANDHVITFRVVDWRETAATSTGEIAEVIWVDPQNVPEDATPGTKRRLEEVYNGAPTSPFW